MHDLISDRWLISIGAENAPRVDLSVSCHVKPRLRLDQWLQTVLASTESTFLSDHRLIVDDSNSRIVYGSCHSHGNRFTTSSHEPIAVLAMSE